MDTRVGTTIAGYRIESVIGRGGMGVVYLAEHLRLKRKVALKVLAPELAEDERFRERFVQESELAASLEHANIVPIYDAGEADGLLYIAMRFVEGTDLKTLIEREGALEPRRAAGILTQVASALDAAHAKGLIHRDVKPANVLIARDVDGSEHAYLTDFGVTKRPDQTTGLTKTGQFMGSVDYAAPEQFEGKPLDARTDVYSLACVAYECLTGRVPFLRDQEAAVMYAHLKAPPPPFAEAEAGIPSEVESVVARGMAKRQEDRYRSAGGLAAALRTALGGPEGPGIDRSVGRRRTAILAGAASVLVLGAGLAAIALARGGTKTPPSAPASSPSASTISEPVGSGAAVRIDPSTNTVSARLGLSGSAAVGEGFAWIATKRDIRKIDPGSNKVVFTIPLQVDDIAAGEGYVWATAEESRGTGVVTDSLYRIDPATNHPQKLRSLPPRIATPFGLYPGQIALGEGSVWITDAGPNGAAFLLRFDAKTGRLVDRIDLPDQPEGVAYGEGAVWVRSNGLTPSLTKVDPGSGKVTGRLQLGGIDAIAAGNGNVWVADLTDNQVVKVDPSSTSQAGLVTGQLGGPEWIAVDRDGVWVVNRHDCSVARIDPGTNRVVATIPLHVVQPLVVAASDEAGVWVADTSGGHTQAECG